MSVLTNSLIEKFGSPEKGHLYLIDCVVFDLVPVPSLTVYFLLLLLLLW